LENRSSKTGSTLDTKTIIERGYIFEWLHYLISTQLLIVMILVAADYHGGGVVKFILERTQMIDIEGARGNN
jgi:hypothetical protein